MPHPDRGAGLRGGAPELAALAAGVLGLDNADPSESFPEMGGDALSAHQLSAVAAREGCDLAPTLLLSSQPLHAVYDMTQAQGGSGVLASNHHSATFPLTPHQQAWFRLGLPDVSRWHILAVVQLDRPLELQRLRLAVASVVRRHDALRLRFRQRDGRWSATYADEPAADEVVSERSLPRVHDGPVVDILRSEMGEMVEELDVTGGHLLRVRQLCDDDRRRSYLCLVVSHLVFDGISIAVVLNEIEEAYRRGERAPRRRAPAPATFGSWAHHLLSSARSGEVLSSLDHWRDAHISDDLPCDDSGPNTMESMKGLDATLVPWEAIPTGPNGRTSTRRLPELTLAAFGQAVHEWSGARRLTIYVTGHGRDQLHPGLDVSRTVGWFTTLYPVSFQLGPTPSDTAASIVDALQRTPHGGHSYGQLRYQNDETASRLTKLRQPDVNFLFESRGVVAPAVAGSRLFRPLADAPHAAGRPRSGARTLLFQLNGSLEPSGLNLAIRYSENRHHRRTVQRLLDASARHARALTDVGWMTCEEHRA